MKTVMSLMVLMGAGFASLAQVEVDDMYFNAKDRAKLRESQQKEIAQRDLKMNEESKKTLAINPTDSYSSRNINPEYTSRQKTSPSNNNAQEDQGYFPSGYQQPVGVNQTLRNNNYYGYNNSYYGNAWSNPYYGYSSGFGSPYGNFWGSPFGYGGSGWSMSMGYNWGYPGYGWNSWGMPSSLFWNNYYGNSFCNTWGWGYGGNMWGSNYWGGYNPYYGYSNYYGGGYYPVVVDNGKPRPVYGKRNDRSSSLSNDVDNARPISSVTRSGREISSGRTRSEANSQPTYYERSWRQNQEVAQTRSFWGQESGQSRASQSNSGRQSSFWDNNNSFDNNSRSTPTRSWSNDNNSSFSGGSRSHSSSSPSQSSGGTRSRGRD